MPDWTAPHALEHGQGLGGVGDGREKVNKLRNAAGVLVVGRHAGDGVGTQLPGGTGARRDYFRRFGKEKAHSKKDASDCVGCKGRAKVAPLWQSHFAWRASSTASLSTVVPT